MKGLKLIIGRANPDLGNEIAKNLGVEPCEIHQDNFADGEFRFQIHDNIRGTDVFIIQPTFPPAENMLELMVMIDAAKRASARRVTAVIPYFGYARQDRKDRPRVAISSKLFANLMVSAGLDRVLTLDLHAAQIQGFFDIPTDHLVSDWLFFQHIKHEVIPSIPEEESENIVFVSPDIGGVKRVEDLASALGFEIAVIYKRRTKSGKAKALKIVGEVAGRTVIIRDDIIDTAGTITEAVRLLNREKAARIFICGTHGLLSGSAMERLDSLDLAELAVTNTIPLPKEKKRDYIKIINTGSLFASAIHNIHFEKSVSVLFKKSDVLDI